MLGYETMPEVQEYCSIMVSIHRDYCLRTLMSKLDEMSRLLPISQYEY
jgi:hypothetical protein